MLAGYNGADDKVKMVRVVFRIANTQLGALSVGHTDFGELRGIAAKEPDGVLGRGGTT